MCDKLYFEFDRVSSHYLRMDFFITFCTLLLLLPLCDSPNLFHVAPIAEISAWLTFGYNNVSDICVCVCNAIV